MMEETHTPRLTWAKLAVYYALLYAIWALREVYVRQQVAEWAGPLGAALLNVVAKLLIWTLPALLLVRRYQDEMEVPRLFQERPNWVRVLLWMVGLLGYNVIASILRLRQVQLHPEFEWVSLIGTVLFVGITEEAVFRGFLLNAMLKKTKPQVAMAVSSVLFVLIHFPIWHTKGLFQSPLELLGSCLTIFLLGMIFAQSFIDERNLLPPILLHMAWNLGALLLFGP